MKKILKKYVSFGLVLMILLSLCAVGATAAGANIKYALTADGETETYARSGESVPVVLTLTNNSVSGKWDLYTMQDYIHYDPNFFELDETSIKKVESEGFTVSYRTVDANDAYVLISRSSTSGWNTDKNAEVLTFDFKVKATSGTGTISSQGYFVADGSLNRETCTASDAKVSVGQRYYDINVSAGAGGTITPAGSAGIVQIAKNGSQTFTIQANSGYTVSNVLVDGASVGAVTSYTFSDVTANHSISATFEQSAVTPPQPVFYTITASAGEGGTITPSGTVQVAKNGSQSFTINAATGYTIKSVLIDGVSAGVITSYTFSDVTANHSISATFEQSAVTPPQPVSYTITASAGIGGTITPSGTVQVAKNGNQSFTISANKGYNITNVIVDGVSVGAVTTYTFTNVTANHSISAAFKISSSVEDGNGYSICPKDRSCVIEQFTDTLNNAWWHDGIHYCVENKLMNGVGGGKFDPLGTTTRAMIVTILYRLEGSPTVNYKMTFDDVESGVWYTEPIRWAQSVGIVKGYSDISFGPGDYITREQMATILYRYSEYKGYDVSAANNLSVYSDAGSVSTWAVSGMKWCNAMGIITGRTETTLVPIATATRAEAATMLQRYCVNCVK